MKDLNAAKLALNFATGSPQDNFQHTRLLFIRSLGFIYLIVFSIILNQGIGLWGDQGLLPISSFIHNITNHFKSTSLAFFFAPNIFYWFEPDNAIPVIGYSGIILSLFFILGYANSVMLFFAWILQLSFVNSGQIFYSYGWETLLLEVTFISFFLVAFWNWNLKQSSFSPPQIAVWALRWTLFRLMLGAGLIKLRGDNCWTDLTCLLYHYETQPNPHPISYLFHSMPLEFHKLGILFNHFVELIVPFGLFANRKIRILSAYLIAIFQITLILSGNLAWLNWISLILVFVCLDDNHLRFYLKKYKFPTKENLPTENSWSTKMIYFIFTIGIIILSLQPTKNLFSPQQAMNTSYSSWHLINSYGAFGSINRERYHLIIYGSTDGNDWKEYKFKCSATHEKDRPCLVTPYHYHLDWQLWFSGMAPSIQEQWMLRLIEGLLQNNRDILSLMGSNPFEKSPPRLIKIDRYKFQFAPITDWPDRWWQKTFVGNYLPPSSLKK